MSFFRDLCFFVQKYDLVEFDQGCGSGSAIWSHPPDFPRLVFFFAFFSEVKFEVAPFGGSVGWLCLCLCIILYRRSGATEPKKSFRPCYSQKGWLRAKNTEPLKVAPFGQSGSVWPKRSQTEPDGATRSHLGATSEPPRSLPPDFQGLVFFSLFFLKSDLVWSGRVEQTWSQPGATPGPFPPRLEPPRPRTHEPPRPRTHEPPRPRLRAAY